MKLLWKLPLIGLVSFVGLGLEAAPLSSPLTPEAALGAFVLAPGLRAELVAAEPLVASPCAFAFDPRGRMFVAENRGYPIGPKAGEAPCGVIAVLEDTDGDGRMDRRTVFADGLTYPNGVLPWKDGVIVTCAPDVLFLRDTKGDGRATERRVLLTGFATSGSTQLRVNCPTVGPDGWIYLAAGLAGGTITCPEHPERPALKMTADVRFNPETLEVENVDGRSQYGQSFDSAGRRFICMNRLPVQQVVLSSKWLRRNPKLTFSETVEDCNERTVQSGLSGGGAGVRLFPVSSNITTADSHAGSFSAACGIHIWQGGRLPEEYTGCAFSCDPTGNLVHADKLVSRGAAFAAEPLLKGLEFVASRDDWFRPVFLGRGPDQALYVADMYRKVIEHPDYLPEEVRKKTEFESGKEMGRIWRIVAETKLVPGPELAPPALEETWLNTPPPVEAKAAEAWLAERLAAASSEDAHARFLAALVLGNVPDSRATEALAAIAARDMEDRWTRAAVLSGVSGRERELIKAFLSRLEGSQSVGFGAQQFLAFLGGTFTDLNALEGLLKSVSGGGSGPSLATMKAAALPLLLGFSEKHTSRLDSAAKGVGDGEAPWLAGFLEEVPGIAVNPGLTAAERSISIRLLGRMSWEAASPKLSRLATSEPNDELRATAIRALAGFDKPEVSQLLTDSWSKHSPSQRETILNALLTSSFHAGGLLDAMESGTLPLSAISGVRRKQILKHKDPAIRKRAETLFASAGAGREKAFDEAKTALLLAPKAEHGREVFRNVCAVCHRLEREGYAVGPDLLDIRNQTKENILFHIVIPDAEIAPAFTAYIAETKDGRSLSGIMASETPTSITLRGPLAQETSVLRSDLVKMEALPGSLMPAGLDAAMSKQDLADLVSFLKGEK